MPGTSPHSRQPSARISPGRQSRPGPPSPGYPLALSGLADPLLRHDSSFGNLRTISDPGPYGPASLPCRGRSGCARRPESRGRGGPSRGVRSRGGSCGMGRVVPARPITRAARLALRVVWATAALAGMASARAQARPQPPTAAPEASRVDRLEHLVTTVVEENRRLAEEVRSLKEQLSARQPTPTPPSPALPGPAAPAAEPPPPPAQPPAYWATGTLRSRNRAGRRAPGSTTGVSGSTTTAGSRSCRGTSTRRRSRSGSGARTSSATPGSSEGRPTGSTAPATGFRSTTTTTSGSRGVASSSRGRPSCRGSRTSGTSTTTRSRATRSASAPTR